MSKKKIYFFSENVKYRIQGKERISLWLDMVARKEHKVNEKINIILCTDQYLLDMNVKYLNHKFYTDIITFEYNEGKAISGDLFISIDRVKENAGSFGVTVRDELCRVIVHGVLHLYGYDDKTLPQQDVMKKKEDYYLSLSDSYSVT